MTFTETYNKLTRTWRFKLTLRDFKYANFGDIHALAISKEDNSEDKWYKKGLSLIRNNDVLHHFNFPENEEDLKFLNRVLSECARYSRGTPRDKDKVLQLLHCGYKYGKKYVEDDLIINL